MEENKTPPSQDNYEDDSAVGQTVGSFVWELVRVFLLALIIIIPLRWLIAEPFIVSGSSMRPNFSDRQYLIVDKISYRFHLPQRGDVIVFKYPKDPSQYFIKRIIGLPGEKVRIDQGHVIITNAQHPDGFVLDESYLPNQNITYGTPETVTMGTQEYFVLGDNRLASSDSRVWGLLPYDNIVGKVWLRAFPISSFGFIKGVTYNFDNK
jgi:signal peptidase I